MGFDVSTTVLSAASTYSLTTLSAAKVELGIGANDTTNDAWLTQAITQVSRAMARYCKRTFVPELVQDTFDVEQDAYPAQTPGGFKQLVLSRWPVITLNSVVQSPAPTDPQTLVSELDFRLDAETGRLLRLSPWTGAAVRWDAAPLTAQYLAGFGQQVQQAEAVPAGASITVTQASTFSCDLGVAYANGVALSPVAGGPAEGQYTVLNGDYGFNVADVGQAVLIGYAAAVIPDDLIEACLQLVTARFDGKDRDSWLVQQDTPGVGSQRFWVGGTPGQKGPFPPDVTATLDEYRVPTVF